MDGVDPVADVIAIVAGAVMATKALIGIEKCMMRMCTFEMHDGFAMAIITGIAG